MVTEKCRISKSKLALLKPGEKLWDTEITGFHAHKQKTKTTYYYKYRVNGVQKITHIGQCGSMTVDDARTKARRYYILSKDGIDPETYFKNEAAKIQQATKRDTYTISDAFSDWEKHVKPQLKKSSLAEWTYYNRYVEPSFGHRTLSSISIAEVNGFHLSIQKPYSANRSIKILKKLYSVATMLGRYEGNSPFIAVKLHREQPRKRHLTRDEPRRLYLALESYKLLGDEEFKAASCIMLYLLTSARKTEWLSAPKEYVNIWQRTLTLPETKNGEPDIKALPQAAIDILKALYAKYPESHWIFPSPKNKGNEFSKGLPLKGIKRHWDNIRQMAGIDDLRIHDLRRSFASFALTSGFSLHQIGEILNHKNIQTTKGYAYLIDADKKNATHKIANSILAKMQTKTLRERFMLCS